MENLAKKLIAFIETEKSIEFTKEELECFLKMVELSVQIELLESLPDNKEYALEENKKELEAILKTNHFDGFEKIGCLW